MSTLEILKSPGVGTVLFIYGHFMLLGLVYTAGMSSHVHASIVSIHVC